MMRDRALMQPTPQQAEHDTLPNIAQRAQTSEMNTGGKWPTVLNSSCSRMQQRGRF